MGRVFATFIAIFLSTCAIAEVGHIQATGGALTHTNAKGESQPAIRGSVVDSGDLISTGADGWVILAMDDGASLTLSPNSNFRIDDYRFVPDNPSQSRAWLTLLKGALRSITGAIGVEHHPSYRLDTPSATIGIRGTDHETIVLEQGAAGQPAGTYDHVNDGETEIQHATGAFSVKPGEYAVAAKNGQPPRKLDTAPRFYERLHKFADNHRFERVLERLHIRSGNGFHARELRPKQRNMWRKKWEKWKAEHADDEKAEHTDKKSEESKHSEKHKDGKRRRLLKEFGSHFK